MYRLYFHQIFITNTIIIYCLFTFMVVLRLYYVRIDSILANSLVLIVSIL